MKNKKLLGIALVPMCVSLVGCQGNAKNAQTHIWWSYGAENLISDWDYFDTSLVEDILTPLLGILMGGIDFSGLSFTIKDAVISYGNFIQNVINFIIQAF